MKAYLMHPAADFDCDRPPPATHDDVRQDLELDVLFEAMAGGDRFLFDVARVAVLPSLTDPEVITYRQDVLRDCLDHPDVVVAMYNLAVSAIVDEKKHYYGIFYSESPEAILHRSVEVLEMFVHRLTALRDLAAQHAGGFRSTGLVDLCATLSRELDESYFATVRRHLRQLRFTQGTLASATLGPGLHGADYVLRRPHPPSWRERLGVGDGTTYAFTIPDRDEAGARALSDLRGRGLNLVANALAQSTDHILAFFDMLRTELAFYVGCLNLHRRLTAYGDPLCFPTAHSAGGPRLRSTGLYDVCLRLTRDGPVVGNDVAADGKSLLMVTGANQGGKSTFLRSVGLAQLMMQCGMFVGAGSYEADVRSGVFTHFTREEDASMRRGRLVEELQRMSDVVDQMDAQALLLCNESFASTNEREGSEVARQILRALLEAGVKVVYVTHLFDLAHSIHTAGRPDTLFLRAERRADGSRTFRLVEGAPLPTSHGEDVYRRVFGSPARPEPALTTPGRQ
ncbi:MAG: MutS-related protein [Actinomycetota bacterium]